MGEPVDNVNRYSEKAPDVLEQVHAVMHLVRSQFRIHEPGDGLTHMESKVLGFFGRHPGATQRDLTVHSRRDKAQLARLIAGLRARRLLEARIDEEDRRNVRLFLTSEGESVFQEVRRSSRRLATVAVKGLSVDERTQLAALLDRVRTNLENAAGD